MYNSVHLIGNLGADADVFEVNNKKVIKFNLATTKKYKYNDEWKEQTQWHKIVTWNLNSNIIEKLKKGIKVFVVGEINYRSYEKDNEKRYITEIKANRVIILE